MAGGGAEKDKRSDQRTLHFPAIHWIIREVLRDYKRGTRPSKISSGGHAFFSLSLTFLGDFAQLSSLMDPSTKWYRLIDVDLSTNVCRFLATLLGIISYFKNLGEKPGNFTGFLESVPSY